MSETKPNILLITTDQQRADTLGAYGSQFACTPNLDRLSGEGIRFERAYAQNPVSAPSRATIYTGRYPQTHRLAANGMQLPSPEILFTKVLAEAGYDCGLVGKMHLGPCQDLRVEPRLDDGYRVFEWCHGPQHPHDASAYHQWLKDKGVRFEDLPQRVPAEYHYTRWAAERTIDFLRQEREGPFFAWMSIFDPHHPFDPPEEYRERFAGKEPHKPAYRPGELETKTDVQRDSHAKTYAGREPGFAELRPEEVSEMILDYHAMCALIDDEVGRVLAALTETGQADNTLVIFTSDHGDMLGDHGLLLKGPFFYEGLIRVPLILRWPGHIPPDVRPELVGLLDLAPTILEAAGVDIPHGVQGRSLAHFYSAGEHLVAHRGYALGICRDSNFPRDPPAALTMYRTDNFKLVVYHNDRHGELYDLARDPDEFDNQWESRDYRGVRQRLMARLIDVLVETEAPTPARISDW